jgi:hypothetical protein
MSVRTRLSLVNHHLPLFRDRDNSACQVLSFHIALRSCHNQRSVATLCGLDQHPLFSVDAVHDHRARVEILRVRLPTRLETKRRTAEMGKGTDVRAAADAADDTVLDALQVGHELWRQGLLTHGDGHERNNPTVQFETNVESERKKNSPHHPCIQRRTSEQTTFFFLDPARR